MFYIEGPGHSGQVMVSNSYLDGSYTELYPQITQDEAGFKQLCKNLLIPWRNCVSRCSRKLLVQFTKVEEVGYSYHATGAV